MGSTGPSSPLRDASISRRAFVLAGGGSLGATEVGMLQALVEAKITPDLVVGASVGAINGTYFAAAPNAAGVEELGNIWRDLHRRDVFPLSPIGGLLSLLSLRNHVINPASLRRVVEKHLPVERLEEARIPVHVIATDVMTGEEVRLSSGSAADAIMASAAIPALFPPVQIGGRHLSDGGLANNTPLSTAVDLGASEILILPTGFSCDLSDPPAGAMGMGLHALSLLISRQLVVDLERYADVGSLRLRLVPPLCPLDASPADFSRAGELIERAADSTRDWLEGGGFDTLVIPDHMRPHSHDGRIAEDPGR